MTPAPKLPISTLVGEMPGKAKGGAVLPDISPTRVEIGSFHGGGN